ncbi:lipid-A-disaccharide synthase N-terminal domain-containing protein [Olleya sp. HaHaR_3_96]|uniref:lipid-A-disaccharide synthase N-terminal domain-containing protein n=1 Tax=Olleya sp. HaHaR_3_96 TaxID=2745560 RepID=UPI001C4FD402|nr:lipid-A-disaccharide synthase N-terminal domain-containing protein [Olleya sp. HaHaR_3_96]QXP61632.1 lipid-A-disaccharide synthase N-terminal domain-containing protein [Olleya sp. HaHaR_3_96]
MNNWIILSIGFLAQTLFSSRLIIQWITSEKQKRVITPTLFWTLSLIASFLLFIYGYLRDDFAIMLGQGLTYYIYIRNLQLQNQWKTFPTSIRWILLLMPLFITIFYFNNNAIDTVKLFKNQAIPLWLLMLGIVSQIVFTLRFVYQWMYSEKNKESSLPFGFWALSLIGSLLILTYAIFRVDYVLLVGHSLGALIYVRNLLILKQQNG